MTSLFRQDSRRPLGSDLWMELGAFDELGFEPVSRALEGRSCSDNDEPVKSTQSVGSTGDQFDLEKAKRLNFCMKEWLGWAAHEDDIDRLIGFEPDSDSDLSGDFALAVRDWQVRFDKSVGPFLKPDGIIGVATWNAMRGALGMPILSAPPDQPSWVIPSASPYHASRGDKAITHIIYHSTASGSWSGTLKYFKKNSKGVSAHFVIGREGEVAQMVSLDRAAQHAGKLQKKTDGSYHSANPYSIGIEIVNWGFLVRKGNLFPGSESRRCGYDFCTASGAEYVGTPAQTLPTYYRTSSSRWQPYTDRQYAMLIHLTTYLLACIPTITHITGHEHISRRGKRADPGGAFDWPRMRKGLEDLWDLDVGLPFPAQVCDRLARNPRTGNLTFDKTGRIIIPGCP